MNWEIIRNGVGCEGVFEHDGIFIKILINDIGELENGELWFSYVFVDYKECSPLFMGCHTNYANCCWSNNRKGFFSREIQHSFVFIGNPQCDM